MFPMGSQVDLAVRRRGDDIVLSVTIPKPRDRKEPYSLGDGYGHLAVIVDDVDTEHARFEREKLSPGPLRDFKHDGKTLARFFFVADPDGYKIEVIQKGGRFG